MNWKQKVLGWVLSDDFFAIILQGLVLFQIQLFLSTLVQVYFDFLPLWILFLALKHNTTSAFLSSLFFGLLMDSQSSYPAGFYTSSYFLEFLVVSLLKEHLTWLRIQTWMYVLIGIVAYQSLMIATSRLMIQNTFFLESSHLFWQALANVTFLLTSYFVIKEHILRYGVIHEKAF